MCICAGLCVTVKAAGLSFLEGTCHSAGVGGTVGPQCMAIARGVPGLLYFRVAPTNTDGAQTESPRTRLLYPLQGSSSEQPLVCRFRTGWRRVRYIFTAACSFCPTLSPLQQTSYRPNFSSLSASQVSTKRHSSKTELGRPHPGR